jgi:hypothetical protein
MGSSAWGHDFNCCSDECGFKLRAIVREKQKTKQGRKELEDLWQSLASETNALLCGEPYPGWRAEQTLKSLGRL